MGEIFKTLIIILMLAATSSCDIYSPYYLYIDNQTSDTIEMTFSEKSPYFRADTDHLIFPPKYKKLLYGVEEATATKNGCGYTRINESEIEVKTSSGRKLQKEIWDTNNWNCIGSFRRGWEQTFVITDADLN